MHFDLIRETELLVASSATGLLFALTGTGGSSILTPIMTLILGFTPNVAIPSDIVGSISMRATTSFFNIRSGRRFKKIILWLVLGQLSGLGASAIFLANIHLSNSTTDIVLGFTLSLIGCSLALKEFIKTKGERSLRKLTSYALLFLGGSISGLAVAFTSVGGGVITYIAVALAFPKLDTKSVIAIDATAGLMLSILASIEVISTGRGDAAVMVIIAAGGLLGCIGGEKIKGKVSSHLIKEAIAITVSFIGLIYLFRSHQFIAAATLGLLYLLALGLKKRSASKNHPASVESVQLTPIGALEN